MTRHSGASSSTPSERRASLRSAWVGEVRLRAVDGFSVRVRDRRDHDIADMFHVEAAEGSLLSR